MLNSKFLPYVLKSSRLLKLKGEIVTEGTAFSKNFPYIWVRSFTLRLGDIITPFTEPSGFKHRRGCRHLPPPAHRAATHPACAATFVRMRGGGGGQSEAAAGPGVRSPQGRVRGRGAASAVPTCHRDALAPAGERLFLPRQPGGRFAHPEGGAAEPEEAPWRR